jgi:hypothetical protein
MSNLLIDDRPIMFLPMLAKVLGSCERAIVLQQIHWLSRQPKTGKMVDGFKWVWGSYEEWCEEYFPMWKPQNLAKHIRKLEDAGVLISAELNAKQHDHTKHYRLNYEHEWLQPILYSSIASKKYSSEASIDNGNTVSLYSTETSTENTAKRMRPPSGRSNKSRNRHDDQDTPRKYSREHFPDL